MTRHLIRLMWNRKRQNLLLMVEIFVAFLVVVAVAVLGAHFGYNAMQPLGFSYADAWSIEVRRPGMPGDQAQRTGNDRDVLRQIVAELAARPEVERVAAAFTGPYNWYEIGDSLIVEGRAAIPLRLNRADDAFGEVFDVRMVDGRWFTRQDDEAWRGGWEPVIVNRRLAMELFGRDTVAGETFAEVPDVDQPGVAGRRTRPRRVVGVVEDFRQFGELSMPLPVMFYRRTLDAPDPFLELPETLQIRMRPGTTAAVEEALLRRLRALAPSWSFNVQPVVALREAMLRQSILPMAIVAVVAGALLVMVALGLTGVVWQNVTQRMREFGLRRAQGATGAGVGRQVIAELVVMTSFAVAAACILLLQIPLLPLPPEVAVVSRPVFVAGVLTAIVAVYSVTVLCAWYPSRLATRVPPADALRYE